MSKKFDYALVFLEYLKKNPDTFVEVRRISKEFGLPPAYLEKIAQELRRAGWLEGKRGINGGYRLVKDRRLVSVKELISFYEPIYSFCPVLRETRK